MFLIFLMHVKHAMKTLKKTAGQGKKARPRRKKPGGRPPLALARLSAGFPSPAEDYVDRDLDLNEYLVGNPAATFFVRVQGESMKDAGIRNGDVLVVDRSRAVTDNCVVTAVIDGEFTVKRLRKTRGRVFLVPENSDYETREITPASDFHVWGVVTGVVRRL
jgi:DNA polymerase V